jgi:hypothetical protein
MSTESVPAVELPHTWRPFGTRFAGTIFGGGLFILTIGVWIAFGAETRAKFTFFQELTMVAMGLIAFAVWFGLMRCRITATSSGVTIVNGYRRRDFEWSQVVGMNLRRGAPWAGMDLSDGTSISVIALQSSDGKRATDAVRAIRRLIASQTRDLPND